MNPKNKDISHSGLCGETSPEIILTMINCRNCKTSIPEREFIKAKDYQCCDNPSLFVRILGNDAYLKEITLSEYLSFQREGKIITDDKGQEILNLFEVKKKEIERLPWIELPGHGRLISNFANEIINPLRKSDILFYRPDSREIVEINKIKFKLSHQTFIGFSSIKPERFITLAERYFRPYTEFQMGPKVGKLVDSMTSSLARTLLVGADLQEGLKKLERIYHTQIPFILENKLVLPNIGYDERFQSFTIPTAPQIKIDLPLEEAKKVLEEIYSDFCFKEPQDLVNAIAGLLTPFCRGLFNKMNARTPVFFFSGNRERVGKDYCAGIMSILYEGTVLEEPPISNGENSSNNNEELRKKLLSAFIAGRKRLHFANNRGFISNAVFEGIITSEKFSDRALGRNELLTFDNEMDFSLSGNLGISYTPDLYNRCIFINLFLDIEDANSRTFKFPDLQGYVKQNRSLILSSLYSLVKNWFDMGCPGGMVPFASFPEWARVVGGVMESAGYKSPCVRGSDQNISIGGDLETTQMKTLFEICFSEKPNISLTKQEIRRIASDNDLFNFLDFEKKSDQIRFGQLINKFMGRILSDIQLICLDSSVRSARQTFKFSKKDDCGNVGNVGNMSNQANFLQKIYNSGANTTNITIITKKQEQKDPNDLLNEPLPPENTLSDISKSKETPLENPIKPHLNPIKHPLFNNTKINEVQLNEPSPKENPLPTKLDFDPEEIKEVDGP